MNVQSLVRASKRWFLNTPERALDRAYSCASTIRAIEDEHFDGNRVQSGSTSRYSDRAVRYFVSEVRDNLQSIRTALAEFRSSAPLLRYSESRPPRNGLRNGTRNGTRNGGAPDERVLGRDAAIADKLNFIDEVVAKYERPPESKPAALVPVERAALATADPRADIDPPAGRSATRNGSRSGKPDSDRGGERQQSMTGKTSVLPRSLLRTLNLVSRQFDDNTGEAEDEVVRNYRSSRTKASISIRFLLLLAIVPLLTHQFVKIPVSRIIDRNWNPPETAAVFVNVDIEEEAFAELQHYKDRLEFREIIGLSPPLSPAEREEKIREKADEITETYERRGAEAMANIFADLAALGAFAAVVAARRQDIAVLKSYIDELVYGLSDSAKAFLIILFTDIFVGYHSPHGWEVILENVSRHFGVVDSREFNFLFIATFPVILDTVLKYWIFRYLNRISPSAVATYRNMNE